MRIGFNPTGLPDWALSCITKFLNTMPTPNSRTRADRARPIFTWPVDEGVIIIKILQDITGLQIVLVNGHEKDGPEDSHPCIYAGDVIDEAKYIDYEMSYLKRAADEIAVRGESAKRRKAMLQQ